MRFIEHEQSPRWIYLPSVVGAVGGLLLRAVPVPTTAQSELAWFTAFVPVIAMAVLARSWHRRLPVTPHELEYTRVGIAVLTIAGLGGLGGGALPLTFIAGPAFWIWTIVEARRASRSAESRDLEDGTGETPG